MTDLRFADPRDGWAFGGALWSTHDGGGVWQPVRLPGPVLRLEAALGTAWALVDTGSEYALYRSPVGSDSWVRQPLPRTSGGGTSADLALSGRAVIVLDNAPGAGVLVSTDGGATFAAHHGPCTPDLGGRLSAGNGGVWAFCPTGTLGQAYLSLDDGVSWRGVVVRGGLPNSSTIGSMSGDRAAIGLPSGLQRLGADGSLTSTTATPTVWAWSYIGFTSRQVGFALGASPGPSLWRTVDGGDSWHRVAFRS